MLMEQRRWRVTFKSAVYRRPDIVESVHGDNWISMDMLNITNIGM